MITELQNMIKKIKHLNTIHDSEIVTESEIRDALENVDEVKEDLNSLKQAIHEIENSKLNADELTILTIAKFNRYFGDIIQDLQNIAELIDTAAKKYHEHIRTKI